MGPIGDKGTSFKLWKEGISRHPAVSVPHDLYHGVLMHDAYGCSSSGVEVEVTRMRRIVTGHHTSYTTSFL